MALAPAPSTYTRAWWSEGSQTPKSQRVAARKLEPKMAVPAKSLPLWGTRLRGADRERQNGLGGG